MSRQAVIVDTSVVVAGLLTRNAAFPAARILDGMLAVAFPFVVSEALLAEYRALLVRPALRKLHGLTVNAGRGAADRHRPARHRLAPRRRLPGARPGDQLLWDLLAATADPLLAAGDKALQRDAAMRSRVVWPQALVEVALPG